MYFPYVRGRQYELLALRELVSNNLLGDYVVPIVEPVKLSPTLIKTMSEYIKACHPIAIIGNPLVGSFLKDLGDAKEGSKASYKKDFLTLYGIKDFRTGRWALRLPIWHQQGGPILRELVSFTWQIRLKRRCMRSEQAFTIM